MVEDRHGAFDSARTVVDGCNFAGARTCSERGVGDEDRSNGTGGGIVGMFVGREAGVIAESDSDCATVRTPRTLSRRATARGTWR